VCREHRGDTSGPALTWRWALVSDPRSLRVNVRVTNPEGLLPRMQGGFRSGEGVSTGHWPLNKHVLLRAEAAGDSCRGRAQRECGGVGVGAVRECAPGTGHKLITLFSAHEAAGDHSGRLTYRRALIVPWTRRARPTTRRADVVCAKVLRPVEAFDFVPLSSSGGSGGGCVGSSPASD
jgi:hypothetical protein